MKLSIYTNSLIWNLFLNHRFNRFFSPIQSKGTKNSFNQMKAWLEYSNRTKESSAYHMLI